MRFLRRGPAERVPAGDFWTWWATAGDRIAAAIDGGGFDDELVGDITRAVRSIHPALAWELAPGEMARHAFCVSPEGNAELRQVALRWLATAPAPEATWEFHAAKQASRDLLSIDIGGQRFDLAEVRAIAGWDEARHRLDVRLWHPGFETAPEPVRLQVAFVFLDSLLGEEEVERWVGEIEVLEAPAGGRTPAELRAEVERRRSEPVGDATWVLGELSAPGHDPAVILADASLKRIDHPFADHHVSIEIVFGVDRMPNDVEAAFLNEAEDGFLRRVGDVATYAGRITAPGRRTLHFVAEDPEAMRPAIDGWAEALPDALSPGLPQLRLRVNFERDMDWGFQRELGVR